jgi:hypothetical protein
MKLAALIFAAVAVAYVAYAVAPDVARYVKMRSM